MNDGVLLFAAFAAISSLVMLISLLFLRTRSPVEARVDSLVSASMASGSAWSAGSALSRGSGSSSLRPADEEGRPKLGDRLVQAGFYRRNSLPFFFTTQIVLGSIPLIGWLVVAGGGIVSTRQAVVLGIVTAGLGLLAPGIWLDIRKRGRQTKVRRALPDALDVIVVCVEAGMSLSASFKRVSGELRTAHPMLAKELIIVQREIQMGYSTGEAMRRFAVRFDLEELRSLASVILQAEKFGASIVHALNVHAESLRVKRFQMAEEKAQKASIKLLFPTIFFIFPSIFVVILAPACFQLLELFARMQGRGG